jgi:HK97 family phage major capsid protein
MPTLDLREKIARHQTRARGVVTGDHPHGARLTEIRDEITAMSRKRDLTAADERSFEALRTEFDDLDRDGLTRMIQTGDIKLERGAIGSDDDARPANGSGLRDRARRVIDAAHRSKSLPDHAAEVCERLVSDGPQREQSIAAKWAIAVGAPAYARAFAKLASDPERGHLTWEPDEADAYRVVAAFASEERAMGEGTGAAGGFMVPIALDPAIMLTSAGSINPLRQISRVVTIATSAWNGISSAGSTAEWKAEAAEAADASPTLAEPNIPVYFGDAFVPYSFEVGMDASNFLQELQKVLVDAADQLQNTAYTLGTGTGQPTGIITALPAGSVVTSATTDVFAKTDVYNVQNALPPRFSAAASWCAGLPIINLMSQFETAAGARLFPEIADGRLLNRPLNELSNLDSVINATQTNKVLLYGDFDKFVIVDRIGTTLEFIPNLVGTNRRPTGQRGAFLWFRTGSDSVVDEAFRLLDVT